MVKMDSRTLQSLVRRGDGFFSLKGSPWWGVGWTRFFLEADGRRMEKRKRLKITNFDFKSLGAGQLCWKGKTNSLLF